MSSDTDGAPGTGDRWAAGAEAMDAVYGGGFSTRLREDAADPWMRDTVEHLFGEVWSRPGLSIRDRRLLVIGATAAIGREDLLRIQIRGALRNGELTADDLQEALLQLAYYVGWGNGTALAGAIRAAVADVAAESGALQTTPEQTGDQA